MHSLKNTVVAILLLGVTYGVYEVITSPEALSSADQSLIGPLDIDDGSFTQLENGEPENLDIQLPPAAAKPAHSTRLPGNVPADTNKMAAAPSESGASADNFANPNTPSTDSLVNRQAKLDFTGEPDKSGKLASAEVAAGSGNNVARDQELIDALKDQLESNDELDSFENKKPSNTVATRANPEKTAPQLPAKKPDTNSFAPRLKKNEPAPIVIDSKSSAEDLQTLWSNVKTMTETGKFRMALETLTPYFGDPDLSPLQRQRLMGWLDALASKVIYSAEHNLNQPYRVQPDDSLVEIANRWNVTSDLVFNINKSKIEDPSTLTPGTELKMVTGPFHAEVDLTNKVMTLYVSNLYAGRFAVQVDVNSSIQPGQYSVLRKNVNGNNPSGQPASHLIQLDNGVCIHSAETSPGPSCIGLKAKDAADLFTIFTEQSQFFIMR